MCSITCPVCRAEIGDVLALCSGCETPHHPECWEFAGGCAVFACGEDRARLVAKADLTAELLHPSAEPLVLDGTTEPEPVLDLSDLQETPRRPARRRESDAVMLVSWVYLAASLVLAIPTVGYSLGGLTGAHPLDVLRAAACGGLALGLKHLGDLLAVGDVRGRAAHLYVCLALALMSVSLGASLILALLALPFSTRRGRQHFARWLE